MALDLTGANLPLWSEPGTSIHPTNAGLNNLALVSTSIASKTGISNIDFSIQNLPAKLLPATANSPNSERKNNSSISPEKHTQYEIKCTQDSEPQQVKANTLCILDSVPIYPHASGTPPVDNKDHDLYGLPQKLFSPNSLSHAPIGGHGESLSYFSDDSLFDYQFSPSSNCSNTLRVNCNEPVQPGSFSLANILGALNLSPTSRIEDPLTIFYANPPGPKATESLTPSMISSHLINKEFSGYFLLLVSFLFYASPSVVHTLVDTGAKVNFISGLVKGSNSATFHSLDVSKPLVFKVGDHTFTERFCAVKNLVYLVILGIDCWRKYNVLPNLKSNLLLLTPPASNPFLLPLLDASLCDSNASLVLCDQMVTPTIPTPLPSCIAHLAKLFDHTRADRLPRHTQFDFSFCLTVDLVKINSPIYPLTLPE
ncbi:hypothetical protein DSO57_1015536 [Entomophthora muscae]|uniref:Uncharacterized protein n=1 Tax=Entomophthora muscae TaxID=34485 RepID=A0ACC2RJT3_9FUNG|nr:hypothetical protein DSO57_1015536 [Entomophthora muscae]